MNNTKIKKSAYKNNGGYTLIEIVASTAIVSLLIAGLMGVVGTMLNAEDSTRSKNDLTQQVRFAMQRMVTSIRASEQLILPLNNNPSTDWSENIRVETIPASAPEGSSTKATAVLAITLDPYIDRDRNGFSDANNDNDFIDLNGDLIQDPGEAERVNEDTDADNNNDSAPGILGIDDDGDGSVDEGVATDNDEDGASNEDPLDLIDNDGDGSIDEDLPLDINNDLQAGIAGVDDDFDTLVDEGSLNDDDEDGLTGEDWYDIVVYYLNGSDLIERLPAQTDVNIDSFITGADFTESIIASNIILFRVERIAIGANRATQINLSLELENPQSKETFSIQTQTRIKESL